MSITNTSATRRRSGADDPAGGSSAQTLVGAVGATPLLEISGARFELPRGVRVLAKLESVNPSGSIKDRPVSRIIAGALGSGALQGRRLLDSSSGNAGIAYAMFGAVFGIGVTLVIPGNASAERLARIRAHGAEVIRTDPIEGYDFAIREAERLAAERPGFYWYANQYSNPDNWRAHYETTGAEIVEQLMSPVAATPVAFVGGVGTGGTITGVARRLREARPDAHVACVVPEGFPGIEGLKPLGDPGDLRPPVFDESLVDEFLDVSSEQALEATQQLARRGVFGGPSSGAFLHAALRLARRGRHRTVVTLINDTGERYASTGMWA